MTAALPTPRTPDPLQAPPLRWGILGTGSIASAFVDALHANTRSRAIAVGSRTADRADTFADRWQIAHRHASYQELVEDPDVDAIYVASPHSEHREHALLAIAAGRPVLVEKSFTRNVAEAREVFEAARAANVPVLEAMWTRFLPHIDVVRQLLADGTLGPIEQVSADHGQYFELDPSSRLFDPNLAGGAMLDLGVYPASFIHFVLGLPGSIQATGSATSTGVDRQVSAVLGQFPDGASGTADAASQALLTTTLAAASPCTAVIAGSKARVSIPGPFYAPQAITLTARDGTSASAAPPRITGHLGLCFEAAHFAQMVHDGRTESPLMTWQDSLDVLSMMDQMRQQIGISLPGE